MNIRKTFAAAAVALMLGAGLAITAAPAAAQTSEQKALIDAAKTQGVVGEQADGYLGFRTTTSDAPLHAAVEAVNAARRQLYAQSAVQAGTTAEVAGARMFDGQLLPRIPAGQWYRNAQGQWVQR